MSNSTVRPLLVIDALVSGATGALLAIAAPMLASWLGLLTAYQRKAVLAAWADRRSCSCVAT